MSRGLGRRTLRLRQVIEKVLFEKYADVSMSVRQVYYQCLGGELDNSAAEYGRLARTVLAMRREGIIPYDRIVDRTRARYQRPGWDSAAAILHASAQQFRRDMWNEHNVVPVVACEKQALEGIFSEICDEYGAPLYVIRGFNSESFDWEWAEDIKQWTDQGKTVVVAYFGDHDPPGHLIEENSRRKLVEFGAEFEWARRGLLHNDLDRFHLTTLPLKSGKAGGVTTKANLFRTKFGDRGAELDSLPPDELRSRVRAFLESHVDAEVRDRVERDETVQRESLALVAGNWRAAVKGAREASRQGGKR